MIKVVGRLCDDILDDTLVIFLWYSCEILASIPANVPANILDNTRDSNLVNR